ncbi:MAG: type II toxin-antitoxin system prevent-host-death family antitoxin [Deltaproteobacteria bacterium]|nr:type II toxin-antitoxin system prevent-host-death family antitoxin [Deltaproteobacteria bacterium]
MTRSGRSGQGRAHDRANPSPHRRRRRVRRVCRQRLHCRGRSSAAEAAGRASLEGREVDDLPPRASPARADAHRDPHQARRRQREAKTRFSESLERAHKGEEVIIAKAGNPYARLVPIVEPVERKAGTFRGQIPGDVLGPVGSDDTDWG